MSDQAEEWFTLAVKAAQENEQVYARVRRPDGRGWGMPPEDQVRRLLRAGIRAYLEWSKPAAPLPVGEERVINR